jgi:simple sugar transport system permease protein
VAILALALVVGSVFIVLDGKNPATLYWLILKGSLGNSQDLIATIAITSVFILAGLGFLVAARSSLWNIGTEGQLFMGAIAATIVSFWHLGAGPQAMLIPLLAGAAAGASYGFIPGFLRAIFRVDEAVVTILLNYPAIYLCEYLVSGPLKDPESNVPASKAIPLASQLPSLNFAGGVTSGIIVAILGVIAIWFLINRTKIGFEMRMMGGNWKTAELMGVNTRRLTMLSMAISGAMAGLAGAVLLQGVATVLTDTISAGYGFTAIAVSALVSNNPRYIVFAAFFFSALTIGGYLAASALNISPSFISAMIGIIIMIVLLRGLITRIKA